MIYSNITKLLKKSLFLILITIILGHTHPNGTYGLDIHLYSDHIEADFDANQDDMLNMACKLQTFQNTPEILQKVSAGYEYYLQNRLLLEVDQNIIGPMKILKWFKDAKGDENGIDSLAFHQTNCILRLSWPLPENPGQLEFRSQVFVEYEINPLCSLKVFWNNTLIKKQFMVLDDVASIPLDSASLLKIIADQDPDSKKKKTFLTIVFAVSPLVLLVVIWSIFAIFRKKR